MKRASIKLLYSLRIRLDVFIPSWIEAPLLILQMLSGLFGESVGSV